MHTYVYIYIRIYTHICPCSSIYMGRLRIPPAKSEGYATSPHVNPRLPHLNLVW